MGTHPIFESDFECLTEIKQMSDRVAQVISEYSKPREDFALDLAIKVGGALVVGGTIGFATRRIHSMGRTMTLSAGVGIGLAVENYSNQLSAPYIKPAVVEIEPKALLLTHSALPLGSVWEAVSSMTTTTTPKQEPVEQVEEASAAAVVVEEEEATPETVVEAILESVEETVEKAIDEVEEAVADVREIVADVAEEVAEVAADVVAIAEEVETVAAEIESIVNSDTVEQVKAEAEHVAEVAGEVEHVAEEVVAVVKEEEAEQQQ